MAYSGYLLKIGTFTFPISLIKADSYSVYKSVTDLDSYVDADGVLHRNALDHFGYKCEFDTIPQMTNTKFADLMANIYGQFSNNTERKALVTMYIPEIDDYVSPYVGISSGKDEGSIYFRVTINDPSHVIVNDRYDVRLLNSNNEVVAQMNNISDSLINRRFTFTGEDVVTRNDYENTGQRMAVIHKTKRTQYGTNVDLGTVVLSENKTEENSFDLIFSDSYRLTSITNVSYSISSVTTGFYVSGTTNFNVRYDPNTKLYTYTINLGEASFLNDNVYLFTFNFYENDVLVNEAEFDYYYGGSNE